MKPQNDLPHLLQLFFKSYLVSQRQVSKHTVAAYRDTFRIFLPFLAELSNKKIGALLLTDLSATHLIKFLSYLENERANSIATRNARLAAIRAFLNYTSVEVPDELLSITRALAVPQKKKARSVIECLDRTEVDALLAVPDVSTWTGRRDRVLLMTMYNTGARVSEITGVRTQDLDLIRQHSIHLHGKGRKERIIPLWKETAIALRTWVNSAGPSGNGFVFPNRFGEPLTRSGVRQRLSTICRRATMNCPSLLKRNVTPHSLRHATALHLCSQASISV